MENDESLIIWVLLADLEPRLWNLVHRAVPIMGRRLIDNPLLTRDAKKKWMSEHDEADDLFLTLDGAPHTHPGPAYEIPDDDNPGKIYMNYGRLHREDGPAVKLIDFTERPSNRVLIWCERGQYCRRPSAAIVCERFDDNSPVGDEIYFVEIGPDDVTIRAREKVYDLARYSRTIIGRGYIDRCSAVSSDWGGIDIKNIDSGLFDKALAPPDLAESSHKKSRNAHSRVTAALDAILAAASSEILCRDGVIVPMVKRINDHFCNC